MIVVDTSVLIANLRKLDIPPVRTLRSIPVTEPVLVGDIVLFEILRGARDDQHAKRIQDDLHRFRLVRMIDVGLAARAAANYRSLRKLGITVLSSIDMILGTFCIEGHHDLLHADRDFVPMVEHLGLRIYRGP